MDAAITNPFSLSARSVKSFALTCFHSGNHESSRHCRSVALEYPQRLLNSVDAIPNVTTFIAVPETELGGQSGLVVLA
jgi:hypothetical protein